MTLDDVEPAFAVPGLEQVVLSVMVYHIHKSLVAQLDALIQLQLMGLQKKYSRLFLLLHNV